MEPQPLKPPGAREFTLRAAIVAVLIAALIGAAYPYVVLKLGFGPRMSVVSAVFGFLVLGIFSRDYNRWENNIVQSAGTAAGATAFLCVLLAAFDLLRADPGLHFRMQPTPLQSFAWLTAAGLLGVLTSVPLRRHFVVEEKLRFPDGVAAGETLLVLDSRGPEARGVTRAMGLGTALSGLVMGLRADTRLVGQAWYRIPELLRLGPTGASMGVGVGWSFLSLGSGMLVGMRVNASMLAGAILSWVVAPPLLVHRAFIPALTRKDVILWVMWPATGMLVAGGLTALFLRWSILIRSFRGFSGSAVRSEDFPMRWVVGGSLACAVALAAIMRLCFGIPVWMTAAALAFSLPLMLVGIRVVGETNWGPVSALSNMMQGIFGVLAPGHIMANMTSSGVTGSVAVESEGLMQCYKTGDMIGSTPRYLTYAQLLAIPVGALAVSYAYPLLRDAYGIGGENGLQSPISQKWAGFAKLLSAGLSALPPAALQALAVSVVLGVLFTVLESSRARKWAPSPTGLGIGMLVPANAVITMFLGAVVAAGWKAASRRSADRYLVPVASGCIAGEAIVAVVVPILVAFKLVHLH
ncbi:MAG TPA: OPT family oligopeptide transporter [Candidatus Saccharimonadales bacterium]|nr:OPT family oligopeptide transporter [Candidatus Saccharimonadales bacterium]